MSVLSDAEMDVLLGGAPGAPLTVAQADAPSLLSDAEMDALAQRGLVQQPMSATEAALRLGYKHLTFGTAPGASRTKEEQAAREHPYVDVASAVPAVLAQTMALGPVAAAGRAVQGAGLVARAARGAGAALEATMLPNLEARGVLGASGQGAKLGAVYSGLEATGSDLTNPDKSWGDTARDVGVSTALGGVGGAGLGAAGHGASRLLGAALNRTVPELRGVLDAARAPETQGARDIMRQLGYDRYSLDDLRTVRAALDDPAQAHRFDNLNLIEALETKPLTATASGELKPEVRVSPNLRDYAQDAASTGGQGRQQAVDRFASRKNEMSARIQGEIDALTTGQNPAPAAADLPQLIDRRFGSGAREADAGAIADAKAGLTERYNRLRKKPIVTTEDLGQLQAVPEFQAALDYAAKNDMIRNTRQDFPGLWSKGDLQKTIVTLSPDNIVDIHHALVLASKSPITGATPETVMAGKLKQFFSGWAEDQFRGYGTLNKDYAAFKRVMEATEHGSKLSIAGGSAVDRDALVFFNKATGDLNRFAQQTAQQTALYDAALQRYQAGARGTAPAVTKLNRAIRLQEQQANILEEFRKAVGQSWREQVERSTDTNASMLIRQATTAAGQGRIVRVLGDREGRAFVDDLLSMEARRLAKGAPLNAPETHESMRFFDRMATEGRVRVMDAFRAERGQAIKDALTQASSTNAAGVNAIVDKLLTEAGKAHIERLWGPVEGRKFIEQLYNKQMQAGFSKTLFGGPDTAYKLARNKKSDALMNAVHGVMHLRPIQTMQALGEIGSAAFKQRRADQANALLSAQGPDAIRPIIDAMIAGESVVRSGQPFVRNPVLRSIGGQGAIPMEHAREKPRRTGNPLLDLQQTGLQHGGAQARRPAPPPPSQRANQ